MCFKMNLTLRLVISLAIKMREMFMKEKKGMYFEIPLWCLGIVLQIDRKSNYENNGTKEFIVQLTSFMGNCGIEKG